MRRRCAEADRTAAPRRAAADDREVSTLRAYVSAVALAGAVVATIVLAAPLGPALRVDDTVIALAFAVLVAELFPVLIVRRGANEEFDVSTAFTVAAVLVAGPAAAVLVQLVSRTCVELVFRRPPLKAVFNVAQKVLSVAAAGAAATVVAGDTPFGPHGFDLLGAGALVAAAAAYLAVNGLLVTVVCALAGDEPLGAYVRGELLRAGLEQVFVALLAPVVAAVVVAEPVLIPLLGVPAWALHRSGRAEAGSHYQARHDALTGLPNRVRLRERLVDDLASGRPVSLVTTDLDRFKEVNDTLGHGQGDRLLEAVGRRMADEVGETAMLGRLQGDEFGIVVDGDEAAASELAGRLVQAFRAPLHVDGLSLEVGLSAGVAVLAGEVDGVDELLRRADVATYIAKENGAGVALYRPDRDHFSRRRLALSGDLRQAIADGEVQPYFQPQVDLDSGVVVGAEALARWVRPDGTTIPPLDFIESAERSGAIKPLTLHVLAEALAARAQWAADGPTVRMAVNLSARSLLDPELVADVERALSRAGAAPEHLELEITESAIMADPDRARRTLERLGDLGIRLAIDDFGTGYSSLAYLSRLPVHTIKVDRSFIRNVGSDPAAQTIVRATIDLGHNLGLAVVAEGVEDVATRDLLRGLGCETAQGFLWSPAVPRAVFPGTVSALDV
jgi:diguanylate cyclase (GGDEF)-like protein